MNNFNFNSNYNEINFQSSNASQTARPIPYLRIVNQPCSTYRMRYKAEKRNTFLYSQKAFIKNQQNDELDEQTSENGLNNNQQKRKNSKNRKSTEISMEDAFPNVQIVNGQGPATLIVTCVTATEPYYIHPHKLVGTGCLDSGVVVLNIEKGETIFSLNGVSIEYTRKNDVEPSIEQRKSANVDPFGVGYNFDLKKIDKSQVRLCFQVYLKDPTQSDEIILDEYHVLKPIVSNIITNAFGKGPFIVTKTSNLSSSACGGCDLMIFFNKLNKDQKYLQAKFYEENGEWQETVNAEAIHYQCAAYFKIPPYKTQKLDEFVKVKLKIIVTGNSTSSSSLNNSTDKSNIQEDENSMASNAEPAANDEDMEIRGYESEVFEFVYTPLSAEVSDKRNIKSNCENDSSSDNETETSRKRKGSFSKISTCEMASD